MGIQEIQLK